MSRKPDYDPTASIEASEAKAIEKNAAKVEPPEKVTRIPVAHLHLAKACTLPGGLFEQNVDCSGSDRQRHWRAWYLPRLQFFELTYYPAPGDPKKPETTFLPREWCRFDPA